MNQNGRTIKMNVGTICYATPSGLGHLAKAFYDNEMINRIFVLAHPRYEDQSIKWYNKEHHFGHNGNRSQEQFLKGLDAIIIFENVFNHWRLVGLAKEKGIKIIIIPMYEWTPNPLPVAPDLVICPSLLDVRYFSHLPHTFINIPVDRNNIKWKQRTKALTFVHNAGHGQVGLTKGTPEVIEAWNHIQSPAHLILRGQTAEPRVKELLDRVNNKNIEVIAGDQPYDTLFSSGDVYINAEQYNGLSLPLQEAYASGMPVITTKRFPIDTWLPNELLVEPARKTNHKVNQTTFERCHIDPKDLAKKVDEIYNTDITKYSNMGKEWGDYYCWNNYKEIYQRVIEDTVNSFE